MLGVYPDGSLKDARVRRDEARKQIANEIDPGEVRIATKAARSDTESIEAVARGWWGKHEPTWSTSHSNESNNLSCNS